MRRRELLKQVLGGAAVACAFPRFVSAQGPTQQPAAISRLNDRLSLITGVGTNVLALQSPEGLIVVDTGAPEFSAQLVRQLTPLSGPARILKVFNTHYHLENTAGNEALRQLAGPQFQIVAHETTREWMATPYWVPAEDRYEKPRPKAAHPTETFYTSGTLKVGAEQLEYGYLINAHTSGDIYVFFKDSNIVVAGGVASPVRDPELDYFTGAWTGGRVDAMDRLLALGNDATRFVPGFGPTMSRTELKAERDLMSSIYDRTVDRVREGDSADDMMNAGVMNGLPRTLRDPRKFLYDVHKGLWAHHNKLAPNVV